MDFYHQGIITRSLLFFLVVFLSCKAPKELFSRNSQLRFIAEYRISNDLYFQNTLVGGLSGIDYNAKKDEYYLVSDDRSATNPARFYTAKIQLSENSIDSIFFTAVSYLRNAQQQIFPRHADDSQHSCDPEAIRFNSQKNEWTWSSEGERWIRNGSIYLQDAGIYNMNQDGFFTDSFLLPSNMRFSSVEKGPRRNSCFEGLSYSPDFKQLLVSVEEPIFEDGPRAGIKDSAAWTRILQFDAGTKKPRAQFAYRLDPVGSLPTPPDAFRINGISDILVIDKQRILVVERSFSTGVRQNTIRVYLAGMEEVTDISDYPTLMKGNFKPLTKKLLLNMDSLGIYVDNIEGVCLGPKMPNGKQSLLFISDNNFRKEQVTQVLLFEID